MLESSVGGVIPSELAKLPNLGKFVHLACSRNHSQFLTSSPTSFQILVQLLVRNSNVSGTIPLELMKNTSKLREYFLARTYER